MATVGKKFTSPDKWEAGWFARLSAGQKLLYSYMWDRCDHSGVLEFIAPVWSAHIGQPVTEEDLQKLKDKVNTNRERVAIIEDRVWLIEYIRFQQQPDRAKPISVNHPMLKTIVRLLKEHNLYGAAKERDQLLFKDFEDENATSGVSKASPSLPEGRGKSLSGSKSASKSGSNGTRGSALRPSSNKDNFINITSSLDPYNKAESILKAYPKKSANSDISIIPVIEDILESLPEAGIKEPYEYLLNQVKKLDRRTAPDPGDYFESLKKGEEVPF